MNQEHLILSGTLIITFSVYFNDPVNSKKHGLKHVVLYRNNDCVLADAERIMETFRSNNPDLLHGIVARWETSVGL